MNLDDVLRSPWFYKSPGPLSLIFYVSLLIYGAMKLRRQIHYEKHGWFWAFYESTLLMGFLVLGMDVIWMSVSALRFLPMYPRDLGLVFAVLGRDAVGMFFCYLFVGDRMKQGIISYKDSVALSYLLLTSYLVAGFSIAPNPSWTDWTRAIIQGAPTSQILIVLLLQFGVGKILTALAVWTWWKK